MNLLPIIYSSLMIFTALVLFVVVVSFITYKIKERNRASYQTAPIDLRANYINRTPAFNNFAYPQQYAAQAKQYSVQPKKTIVKRETEYYREPAQAQPNYDTNLSSRATRYTVEMPSIRNHEYVPSIDNLVRHRTTNGHNKNRFDVVNSKQTGFAGTRESSVNLLNYYADDDDLYSNQSYAKVS